MSEPLANYDVKVDVPRLVAQRPAHFADVHISVGRHHTTLEVEVYGTRWPMIPATRSSPAEGGFALDRVEYNGQDITHLFDDDQLQALGDL